METVVNLIVDSVFVNAKAYVDKTIVDCSIAIDDGKILKIGRETSMPRADAKMDLRNLLVLPGLIDVHVHLRDEGKAYKEDFCSGTAAAAAGGITTVFDMPNNDPVTMSLASVRNRMRIAENRVLVNVGFYSEFPKDPKEIEDIAGAGVVGFKLYMAEQVGGLNIHDDGILLEAFRIVNGLKVPIAVHAEDEISLKRVEDELRRAGRDDVDAFLLAHSENVEATAVKRLLSITAKQNSMHLHFCHVSAQDSLKAIVDGKKSGMPITCEATPHHLLLSAEDLRRIGTLAITVPPVREKHNMMALWEGVRSGWIDILGSDHAPHALKEKEAESVWDVKVGMPGLETTLPLMLTEVKRGRLSVGDLVRLMSENPAAIFKLKGRGCLKERKRADLTIVDLRKKYKIDSSEFHSKAKYSPFDGRVVEGKAVKTFVNGRLIMEDDQIVAKPGSGEIFRRAQV